MDLIIIGTGFVIGFLVWASQSGLLDELLIGSEKTGTIKSQGDALNFHTIEVVDEGKTYPLTRFDPVKRMLAVKGRDLSFTEVEPQKNWVFENPAAALMGAPAGRKTILLPKDPNHPYYAKLGFKRQSYERSAGKPVEVDESVEESRSWVEDKSSRIGKALRDISKHEEKNELLESDSRKGISAVRNFELMADPMSKIMAAGGMGSFPPRK